MEESGKEKWTPGPWSVQPNAHDVPCIVQGPNYRVAVAHRQENRPNEATAAANARLIAAAPSLHAALTAAVEIIDKWIEPETMGVVRSGDGLLGHYLRDEYLMNFRAALLLANTGETENG